MKFTLQVFSLSALSITVPFDAVVCAIEGRPAVICIDVVKVGQATLFVKPGLRSLGSSTRVAVWSVGGNAERRRPASLERHTNRDRGKLRLCLSYADIYSDQCRRLFFAHRYRRACRVGAFIDHRCENRRIRLRARAPSTNCARVLKKILSGPCGDCVMKQLAIHATQIGVREQDRQR